MIAQYDIHYTTDVQNILSGQYIFSAWLHFSVGVSMKKYNRCRIFVVDHIGKFFNINGHTIITIPFYYDSFHDLTTIVQANYIQKFLILDFILTSKIFDNTNNASASPIT